MSILWIYDQIINPHAGGTERVTHSVMHALAKNGHATAGFLVFRQNHPREIHDQQGNSVDDLYAFLKDNDVHVVINQIGYSKWLLEEFLYQGGQSWKLEGGLVVSCLHFGPSMFQETVWALFRGWRRKTLRQKIRRLGRIALLPVTKQKATRTWSKAYSYLIEMSDFFVILSETHREDLYEMSQTKFPERVHVIPNPNTFEAHFLKDRLKQKKKNVLIVSRLEETQKRVSLALRAWANVMHIGDFSDWTLQVIGDGIHAEDYHKLVSEKRIPNVEFIGRSDPEPYYEDASLYLHTAVHEGWGLTITEAMQKGAVPIVMNSSSVFRDFIDDGQNGILVEFGNVKSFSSHLAKLMQNPQEIRRMAEYAIETTRQHDLGRIVEKWSALINSKWR